MAASVLCSRAVADETDNGSPSAEADPELQAIGEQLAAVASGEISIAEVAGLSADQLARVLQLALSQLQVGYEKKAIGLLRGLVALDPVNPIFQEYLGIALEKVKDLDGALQAHTANVDGLLSMEGVDDRLCEAYALRARVNALRGDQEAALGDLEQAKKYDRGSNAELKVMLRALESAFSGGQS